jgi:hypothetical protein
VQHRNHLAALIAVLALCAAPDAGAVVIYHAQGGWHFGVSEGFDTNENIFPQTLSFGDFSHGGALCPAPGTPNFLCAHVSAKADLVGGRRLTLHAESRLKRTDADGITSLELVYAIAQVFMGEMGTSVTPPIANAYVSLGLSGFRSQSISHPSLVPQAMATVSVNGIVAQCFADSCPPIKLPNWDGKYLTLTLRTDARVGNPQPGVLTGWDAEMIADFSDTLELLAIALHDADDQPIPGAAVWVDDDGTRLDIPTSLESTTTTTSTSTTSTSVTTSTLQPALDRFRCYSAKTAKGTPKPAAGTVRLGDRSAVVQSIASVCNPAAESTEGIGDPTAHLACYAIKDAKGQPKVRARDVTASDQLGGLSLRLSGASTLCVPSAMDGAPLALAVDHFECRRAKVPKGAPPFVPRTVVVADQFESRTTAVTKPLAVCTAVNVNDAGLRRPADTLICYATKNAKGFPGRRVTIADPFGDATLDVKKPTVLCLPGALL